MTARNFREVHVSILISAYGETPAGADAWLLLRNDVELENLALTIAGEIDAGTCGGTMVHTRSPKTFPRKPKVSV